MKVAYLLHSFPHTSETFILDEITSVLEAGVEVQVYSLERPRYGAVHDEAQALIDAGRVTYCAWPGRVRKAGMLAAGAARHPVRVARMMGRAIRRGLSWRESSALALARWFEAGRFDRLHAHFAHYAGQVALAVHRWCGMPFTVTTHAGDVFYNPPDNYPDLATASQRLVCISDYTRRYIAEHFGVPLERMTVIHSGLRLELFPYEERRRAPAGGPVGLLCVGRLHAVKGHRDVIEAVRLLREAGMPCTLTLAGGGPEGPALERQVAEAGLADAVRFLGFQSREEVRTLYRAADLLVLGSLSEGIPVVTMEAMASGVPVVATAVRGVPELVEDRGTGRLCPPERPDCLAEAIRWTVEHPEEVREMTRRGRQRVDEHFDRKKCTRQLIDLWSAAKRW